MSSDEQIQKEILARLHQYSPLFDPSEIRIEVDNGYVTLTGMVDNRRSKHLTQGAAMLVPGVRGIQNRLQLKPAQEQLLDPERNQLEDPEDHRRETAINSDYPGYDPQWVDIYLAPESTFSEYQEVSPGAGPNATDRDDEKDPTKRIAEEIYERLQHGHIKADNIKVAINGGQVTLNGTIDSRRAKEVADEIASSVEGVSQILNQLRVK